MTVVRLENPLVLVNTMFNLACDLCKNNVEFNVQLKVEGEMLLVCETCLNGLVAKEIEARAVTKVKKIKCLKCESLHDSLTEALDCCNKSSKRDEFTCTYCHASYRNRQQADMCCPWYKVVEVMV
jgi:hypothetical protein